MASKRYTISLNMPDVTIPWEQLLLPTGSPVSPHLGAVNAVSEVHVVARARFRLISQSRLSPKLSDSASGRHLVSGSSTSRRPRTH